MAKTVDVVVLNSFQASGADVDLTKGKVSLDAGASDVMGAIPHQDIMSVTNTPYSAGVAQVVDVDFNGLTAAGTYSITVEHNDSKRTYSATFAAATTAAAIATALVAEFARYAGSVQYTAAVNATDDVRITMSTAGIANGAMTVSAPTTGGAGVSTSTAYVAPSGTTGEISVLTNKTLTTGGQYTKHSVVWKKEVGSNIIPGLKAYREVETLIYAEENAANFSDYETAMDQVLGAVVAAGSAGLDSTDVASLSASVANYLSK